MLVAVVAVASLTAVSVHAAEIQRTPHEEGFGAAAVVSDQALAAVRAKGDGSIQCLLCTANGTSIINGNAFQNAVGVFTIVQNTGNQVFLTTVTVVNVSISP